MNRDVMVRMRHLPLLATVILCGASARGLGAQDVEMLGRHYGTRPPPAYYDALRRDQAAFSFRRGRAQRLRVESATRSFYEGARAPAMALGPREGPVVGDFAVPVLLGLYANSGSPPPFGRATIEDAYFGGQAGSITHYYDEVSGGRVTLDGRVQDWRRVSKKDSVYTGGESGLYSAPLGGGGAGNFVYELVALQTLDWGQFDNDGPDGVPNSGDDDGFVDVVAVVFPTRGAECGGSGSANRIWSHRWSLSSAVGTPFTTSTPTWDGTGSIRIDDYTIQPSIACSGSGLNEIGVFTHELGHAFGLPDLYDTDDTDGRHAGTGTWDLMGSGSWGCNNSAPASPCHMGAWSKAQLGWVDVVPLAPDTDHGTIVLPPVVSSDTVYQVDANDGSNEYFLLEYRTRTGYDQYLPREGLLVWQIDPDWIASRWADNRVNAASHMGVWLRQADGGDDLGTSGGGRGDAGDPFPGATGNTAFHAATNPAATSYDGTATGVTILDIAPGASDVAFRLLTRFSTVTLTASGSAGADGLFTVDGAAVDPPATTFASAPFVTHTVEASAGESVAPGERRPFVRWADAPDEPRVRTIVIPIEDFDLVAEYGGSQYRLSLTLAGGVAGVEPASIVTTPLSSDLWFESGAEVTVEARPTQGFSFVGWSGDLAGRPNPASLTMSAPRSAGADFELVYAVSTARVDLTATEEQDLQLVAEGGTPPYAWQVVDGALPEGLVLSRSGRITGASIDLGTFPVTLEAVDGIGLPAVGEVTLEVGRPSLPIEQLVSPFLLSGPALTSAQLAFLNRQGNGVAGYDIGDFRAWLQSDPTLPLSAYLEAADEPRTIVLPMRFTPKEERR